MLQLRMGCSLLSLLLLLGLATHGAAGLRVLMVSSVSTRSHYFWSNALTEGLLAAGHQVVELTTLPPSAPHPNRTTFAVGKIIVDQWTYGDLADLSLGGSYEMMKVCIDFTLDNCRATLTSQAFKDAVEYVKKSKIKFDVMVIDYAWQSLLLGMAHVAGRPPVVAITAYMHPIEMSRLMGNPIMPALVTHDVADLNVKMNFWERLENLKHYVLGAYGDISLFQPEAEKMYRQHFGQDAPPLAELREDVALAMVNTHPVLHGARPNVPSIVEVGLLHTKPGKPLPADLKELLDGASNGFVYMSFGTIVKSSYMSPVKRRAILEAFSALKYLVLWKFENDDLLDKLPPNVHVRKWLPQNDILAHPNIRVFVSHCGGLSSQELAYHGVPVLGVPFVVDQFTNAKRNVALGIGQLIRYDEITRDTFLEVLQEVLENPKYLQNARRLSATLRDQKETPLERAVWWVEYVARTGGAPHLRSHARDLSWYQIYMLDVLAVLVAGTLLLVWLLASLFCRRSRRRTGPRRPRSKTD